MELLTNRDFPAGSLFFSKSTQNNINKLTRKTKPSNFDTISFSKNTGIKNFTVRNKGNVTQIISFGSYPQLPIAGIKCKVKGVSNFQENCLALDKSNWKDGDPLELTLSTRRGKKFLDINHPQFRALGRVPDDITKELLPLIKKGYNFKVELAEVLGGQIGAPTIGLKVNLICTNKDNPKEVSDTLKKITEDTNTKSLCWPYQPVGSLDDILNALLPEQTVESILKEINNAKSILLVGHKNPDGDTIGCVLGLYGALKNTDKKVDCSIDDTIPGMFRHNLPNIDEIKKADQLDPSQKYDLVMIMDTPTPLRVGGCSHFAKTANKIVFIDHHPLRKEEWDNNQTETGISLDKIQKDNLLWVKDKMPAACQMVAGLCAKLMSNQNLNKEQRQEIAKPLLAGMMTDSGGFARGADVKLESTAKYFMEWADFGKKWLRDKLKYNIALPAREKLIDYANKGLVTDDSVGYGSIQINNKQFNDVFKIAKVNDPDVTDQDIVNELKYSEIYSNLRGDDKIAVSMIEKKSKEIDGEDEIIMSFRSGENTDYAQKIAEYLGGGGHGAASGATIIGHKLEDKFLPDKQGNKNALTLERKVAEMAADLKSNAKNNVVSFMGWFKNLNKAS